MTLNPKSAWRTSALNVGIDIKYPFNPPISALNVRIYKSTCTCNPPKNFRHSTTLKTSMSYLVFPNAIERHNHEGLGFRVKGLDKSNTLVMN